MPKDDKPKDDKPKITMGEAMAVERAKLSKEKRDVPGLVALLRKMANDLENEYAIEMDFNVKVEELAMFDHMEMHIETYHVKPEVEKQMKIRKTLLS